MRFWRSFYDLVIEVYRRFSDDDGAYLAASISYYALFSIFPLLLLAISIAGYLFASRGSEAILAYTDQAIPQFTAAVKSNIEAVAMNRQSTGLIGALTLLWTGSMVFDAIGFTLNKIWKVSVGRHFLLSKLLSLASVIVVIVVLMLTTLISAGYETFQNYWLDSFQATPPFAALSLLNGLVALAVTFVALVVIYKVIPNVSLSLRDVWIGAVFATLSWTGAKGLFALYASRVARFNAVYGSVGVIIGLLLWLYITGMILILGAEISVTLKNRRELD